MPNENLAKEVEDLRHRLEEYQTLVLNSSAEYGVLQSLYYEQERYFLNEAKKITKEGKKYQKKYEALYPMMMKFRNIWVEFPGDFAKLIQSIEANEAASFKIIRLQDEIIRLNNEVSDWQDSYLQLNIYSNGLRSLLYCRGDRHTPKPHFPLRLARVKLEPDIFEDNQRMTRSLLTADNKNFILTLGNHNLKQLTRKLETYLDHVKKVFERRLNNKNNIIAELSRQKTLSEDKIDSLRTECTSLRNQNIFAQHLIAQIFDVKL